MPRRRLNAFFSFLREEGYAIGVPEVVDSLGVLASQEVPSRENAWHVLRALSCRSPTEWLNFDALFRRFWFPEEIMIDDFDAAAQVDPRLRARSRVSGIAGTSSAEPESVYGDAGLRGTGAGQQRNITRTDYRFLADRRAMRQVEKLAERLAVRLLHKRSRRFHYAERGSRLDIRRTLRKNLCSGGFPARRVFRDRRAEPGRLVIFHDISHSMAWNNPLLFRFARGLVRTFRTSEAFAFHTRLFKVTDYYREHSLETMRKRLEANNRLWMGGTRIGESLQTFNQEFAATALTSRTIVLIISDGFDTDKPERLGAALDLLARYSRGIVWLNPMLGREGVTLSREMLQERFPQVACFLAANSLRSLEIAVDKLGGMMR